MEVIMARLTVALLGAMQVADYGVPFHFAYTRARALLAYLAVEADRPHERDALAGLLWPDLPNPTARTNLRQVLTNLSAVFAAVNADVLRLSRDQVELHRSADWECDVTRVAALLDACDAHVHRNAARCRPCIGRIGEAVQLYQGAFLAGFKSISAPFEQWMLFQRETLQQRMVAALDRLAMFYALRGEDEQALQVCRRQIIIDQLHEPAYERLMLLLTRAGQRSAALRQYERFRTLLERELGAAPGNTLSLCYEQIRNDAGWRTIVPPQRSLLPACSLSAPQPIGREADLAALDALLADPRARLITVVGACAEACTQLVAAAAARHVGLFADGVIAVNLDEPAGSDSIVPTIAQTFGIRCADRAATTATLGALLHERELLLALAGLTGLPEERAALAELLTAAPGLCLLGAAAQPLGFAGERVFALGDA
jgi:DNA-binding SARP family transcriptional activator